MFSHHTYNVQNLSKTSHVVFAKYVEQIWSTLSVAHCIQNLWKTINLIRKTSLSVPAMYIEHVPHENHVVFIVYTHQTKSTLQYIQNTSNLHRLCLIWASHILSSYTKIHGPPSEWQHFDTFCILRFFFVFSWMCFLCACQMIYIYMFYVYCTIIQVCTILRLHTWFMENTNTNINV